MPNTKSGFLFTGFWITDPTVSECGRFQVDPVTYYGKAYLDWKNSILQAEIDLSLNNAVENGYELDEWDAKDISDDLSCYDKSFECEDPSSLVPFIQEWLDERKIKVAELGGPNA